MNSTWWNGILWECYVHAWLDHSIPSDPSIPRTGQMVVGDFVSHLNKPLAIWIGFYWGGGTLQVRSEAFSDSIGILMYWGITECLGIILQLLFQLTYICTSYISLHLLFPNGGQILEALSSQLPLLAKHRVSSHRHLYAEWLLLFMMTSTRLGNTTADQSLIHLICTQTVILGKLRLAKLTSYTFWQLGRSQSH